MRYVLFLFCCLMTFVICPGSVWAGTTGKISGKVIDAETKEPLPGVNVFIENTTMGAATDVQGHYVILNVPPGRYILMARMMGYSPTRVQNVNVSIDLTTEINFELTTTVLAIGEAVTITAERPMVIKDQTATTAVVGAEDFQALPVTEVSEAVELQAGLVKDAGGGLHVRGGRSGEISYWIDGIPVTDMYDGGTVVDINKNMVQELQVVSGAFNAEYGQAMSGIVNIATKEGTNRWGGSVSTYFGDYLSNHKDIFPHIDHIDPSAIRNIDLAVQGPLVKDKFFVYLNGRGIHFDGYHYGQRLYNPNALVSIANGIPDSFFRQYMGDYLNRGRQNPDKTWGVPYIFGSNAFIDSMIVFEEMPASEISNRDSLFGIYYNRFRQAHKDGRGDEEYVPMNWNRKYYGQGKMIYKFTPSVILSYNFIYDNVHYQDYSRDYQFNPDGLANHYRIGKTHIAQLTHAVSNRTFYKVGFSFFRKDYKRYLYEDMHDSRYVHPDLSLQAPFSFKTAGTDNGRFERNTETLLAKFDLTSQITNTHQIKTGIEFRRHRIYQRDITLRPIETQSQMDMLFNSPYIETRILPDSTIYASQYLHNPLEFSAYVQDKMEFKNFIVNVGVRFDYFEPDGQVLVDESDPTITNPIKPQNRFKDIGSDGIPNSFDPDGTEGNGIWDMGEPAVTLSEREQNWYMEATAKYNISPRLGVSFPITDRGVIHFSYGHFFQIPRFERLYQNPDFELDSGTGNVGVIGNADLEPEQTISGEIGLQQQLSDDIAIGVTGYFRDIRNLAGTRSDEIVLFGGSARYSKIVNSDFGFVKGIVFSFNKRFSGGFSASMDYTLQEAKGSNSDPEQARNALAGNSLPEVQLSPLNWDQKHTFNMTLSYASTSWGGSIIGQWGSGLPYTPRRSEDITSLLTNSQRKKSTYNIDMRAYKDFRFAGGSWTLFARVLNLLDTLNEINVFDDTGRAGYTTDLQTARRSNPPEIINSLTDYYTNATHYSEPRRIELGVTYVF